MYVSGGAEGGGEKSSKKGGRKGGEKGGDGGGGMGGRGGIYKLYPVSCIHLSSIALTILDIPSHTPNQSI